MARADRLVLQQRIERDALRSKDHFSQQVGVCQGKPGGSHGFHRPLKIDFAGVRAQR